MNTENNVANFESATHEAVKREVLSCLENRAGKWVAEGFLFSMVIDLATPNLQIGDVIADMVKEDLLEKTFHVTTDKFNRAVQLPLYRLTPKP